MSKKLDKLNTLLDGVERDFNHSPYAKTGIRFVRPKGSMNPAVILVGEHPGRLENAKREPFVGAAGEQLRAILARVDIPYEDVYLTNVLKYWPVKEEENGSYKTRPCDDIEIANNAHRLIEELDIIADSDTVIGLCGRAAMRAVFPEYTSMTRVHMMSKRRYGHHFVFVYPPSALLYDSSLKTRRQVEQGYELIGDLVYDERTPA